MKDNEIQCVSRVIKDLLIRENALNAPNNEERDFKEDTSSSLAKMLKQDDA
jgi:hypothetical protein